MLQLREHIYSRHSLSLVVERGQMLQSRILQLREHIYSWYSLTQVVEEQRLKSQMLLSRSP